MKRRRRQTTITDLDYDVLKYIMVLVAMSEDGPANIARALPVCKFFMRLAGDEEVLKAVSFDNLKIFDRLKLFQQYNGLLTRCSLAGNAAAEYLFAKLMLVSCSQLLESGRKLLSLEMSSIDEESFNSISKRVSEASSFMAHFDITRASSSKVFPRHSNHYQLLRRFLCHCSHDDFSQMQQHIRSYFDRYIERSDHLIFIHVINNMKNSCSSLRDLERITTILKNLNYKRRVLEQLRPNGTENKEKFKTFLEQCRDFAVCRLLLEVECKERGLNGGLILRGDLKEFRAAYREAVGHFEMYRSHAISVIDDIFFEVCHAPQLQSTRLFLPLQYSVS
uniref:Uncharacterized protein n=1 Tax=Rhizophora mucronata TaxID=61149 RepID=A0A2P2PKA1_RHIMU